MTPRRRLLLIYWTDAVTEDSGWKAISAVEKQRPMLVQSVGWEIKRTRKYVTLASSIVDTDCDGDITIPIGMVVKEVEWKP